MDYDLTNVDIDAIGVSCNYDSFRLDTGRIITRKGLTTIEELPKKPDPDAESKQWMESLLTKNPEAFSK